MKQNDTINFNFEVPGEESLKSIGVNTERKKEQQTIAIPENEATIFSPKEQTRAVQIKQEMVPRSQTEHEPAAAEDNNEEEGQLKRSLTFKNNTVIENFKNSLNTTVKRQRDTI